MTPNKRTVEQYLEGFRRTDHAMILDTLTDDVEWVIPGFFRISGKEAFDAHIEDENFTGSPTIATTRMTEESDVVVVEGTVHTQKKGGEPLQLAFCDVFELAGGKIRRLYSYLVQVP